MATPPTLEQLQLELQEIKETLSTLTDLQKLELLEIRKSRLANFKHLSSVGNRLFQLLTLIMIGATAVFVYNDLGAESKSKVAESLLIQLIPVGIGGLTIHQIYAKKKEHAKFKSDASEDEEMNNTVEKYLVDKYLDTGNSNITKS